MQRMRQISKDMKGLAQGNQRLLDLGPRHEFPELKTRDLYTQLIATKGSVFQSLIEKNHKKYIYFKFTIHRT